MSTRSTIGAIQANGLIKAIYIHCDGYPSGVGAQLREFYKTSEAVDELLNLGDLSALNKRIGEKQSPSNPAPGTCVSYSRDFGLPNMSARLFYEIPDWLRYYEDTEYAYLFNAGVWEIV